uniref:NR LBD domain-containing protein n=1 Tax=Hucho hucho TaxID=62062 RepID=A0A4W5MWS0_9TELE
MGMKMESVQSERKPIDLPRERPANCAVFKEKIYIRKNRMSPLITTPSFITAPDHLGLNSCSQIEKFQEKAQMELQDYVQKTFPDDTYRLTLILMRLPTLRLMTSSITEELFFIGLIGNVTIYSIIPYILKMETTTPVPQRDSPPTTKPLQPISRLVPHTPKKHTHSDTPGYYPANT